MAENGKYLPVLYTIPRWNLTIKKKRGSRSVTYCYSPLENKWISKMDRRFNIQDWYDRWFLNITVPLYRPKCPICGKYCRWLGDSYSSGCSVSHSQIISYNTTDRGFKLGNKLRTYYLDHPEVASNIGKNLSKYYIDHPEARIHQSEMSIKSWENPSESRLLNGCGPRGDMYYEYSEGDGKKVKFDSKWEIDFYHYIIEIIRLDNSKINEFKRTSPVRPRYYSESRGRERIYVPDFYIKLNNGVRYLIEIKPNCFVNDVENIEKFEAAKRYSEENDYKYVILTEDYLYPKEGNQRKEYYGKLEL